MSCGTGGGFLKALGSVLGSCGILERPNHAIFIPGLRISCIDAHHCHCRKDLLIDCFLFFWGGDPPSALEGGGVNGQLFDFLHLPSGPLLIGQDFRVTDSDSKNMKFRERP